MVYISIIYLFNAYVKIILSYILTGFHAISFGAFDQRLASPSSYAAFVLLRAIRCLNTGALCQKSNSNSDSILRILISTVIYLYFIIQYIFLIRAKKVELVKKL